MTLSEFLLDRIVEDEADASSVHELDCDLVRNGLVDPGFGWTCSCGYPARVLAECDAKRRIVEEHPLVQSQTQADVIGCDTCGWDDFSWGPEMVTNGPCVTLRALAIPYADHPDYRAEWKP